MGIQNVNGTNVYQISADVPRATDGRGKSYGTMYTDLRWQIWKEVQMSALKTMEFEQGAYQSSLEGLEARLLQNQKDIAGLRSGELEAQDALHKDRLNYTRDMEKAKAQQTTTRSGGTTTRSSQLRGSGSGSGGYFDEYLQDTIATAESNVAASAGGTGSPLDSEAQEAASISGLIGRGNAVMEGGVAITIEGEEGPAVIDAVEHPQFQAAIVEHSVSKAQRDVQNDPNIPPAMKAQALADAEADVLDTYRAQGGGSFADAYGKVGNIAGTTFQSGSSTRFSKRTSDYVPGTEAPAGGIGDRSAELQRLLDEQARLQAQRAGFEAPGTDLLQRTREDFASRVGPGGFGTDPRKDRRQELFDEKEALAQADDIMAARSGLTDMEMLVQDQYDVAKEYHDRLGGEENFAAMKDAEGNLQRIRNMQGQLSSSPVAEGDFLSNRREESGVQFREGPGLDLGTAPALEDPEPPRDFVPEVPLATTAGPAPAREDLTFLEELGGPLPEQDFGAPPSAAEARQYVRPASQTLPSPAFRNVELDFLGAQELAQEPRAGFRDPGTVESLEGAERTAERLAAGLPAQRSVAERRLPSSVAESLPVGAEIFEEKLAPNQRERRANYQARMIMAGVSLAKQKKKFERISKPNLTEAQRQTAVPEYARLVEELYETNISAGADPIKASFDEIAKIYADDPKMRKQAHTYLFALDMLKTEKPE